MSAFLHPLYVKKPNEDLFSKTDKPMEILTFMTVIIYNASSTRHMVTEIIWQFFVRLANFGTISLTPSFLNTLTYAVKHLNKSDLTLLMCITILNIQYHVTQGTGHYFLPFDLFKIGILKLHGGYIQDLATKYNFNLQVPHSIIYSTKILSI
jgi:hypothetical protein